MIRLEPNGVPLREPALVALTCRVTVEDGVVKVEPVGDYVLVVRERDGTQSWELRRDAE